MADVRVVLHPVYPPGVGAVLEAQTGIELVRPSDEDGVAQALSRGGEVLVTYKWRDDYLTPSLRWVAGTGAGTEQYPLDELDRRGVVLTTASGVHSSCVAEHAFALLLACTRRLGESMRSMEHGRWDRVVGEELAGKKLLVVGLGRIGEELVQRTEGWGMSVAGIKRDVAGYDGRLRDVRPPEELDASCEWADVVVLAAPANATTQHLIGARQLDALGAGWLVNVGRGSLVDEAALVQALTRGRLRGAGLDVTEVEPLAQDSALWSLPNVVLSAHNAGDSPGYGVRWGALFRHNLPQLDGDGDWTNRVLPAGAVRA